MSDFKVCLGVDTKTHLKPVTDPSVSPSWGVGCQLLANQLTNSGINRAAGITCCYLSSGCSNWVGIYSSQSRALGLLFMLITLAISFRKQLTRPHLHLVLRRLTNGREATNTTALFQGDSSTEAFLRGSSTSAGKHPQQHVWQHTSHRTPFWSSLIREGDSWLALLTSWGCN